MTSEAPPVRAEETHDGRRLRITLDAGRGNVIDRRAAAALLDILRTRTSGRTLCAISLEAVGSHFCFGASVQEHAPETAAELLGVLHDVVLAIASAPVPVVAAVRGACLGGGLELVLPCHRIVAAPGTRIGLPEVTLGMYAPAGSLLLPQRVRPGLAEEMLLGGRLLTAEEALVEHLVDELADDVEDAATRWIEQRLLPQSASAVRFATRAARHGRAARLETELRALERNFVEELMATADAQEGVLSFVEKRRPVWVDA